jgi:hypothetical protein
MGSHRQLSCPPRVPLNWDPATYPTGDSVDKEVTTLGLVCHPLVLDHSFFVRVVLGLELRAYTLSHSTSLIFFFLMLVIFEIGSHELFSWAGFKLRSS